MSKLRQITQLSLLVLLTACATDSDLGADHPAEYLDETTGGTITVVERPLIFARERRDLAANARDYVTLAAATVNRSGKVHYTLVGYVWSTVDPRLRRSDTNNVVLLLSADDRRIRLTSSGRTAAEQGISTPIHPPPGPSAAPVVYETDLDTLRYLANAHRLALQLGAETTAPSYAIWDDQRAALARFVNFITGGR